MSMVVLKTHTVKAPVSRHPQEAEIVSVTGAGRLSEQENTNFVWEPGERGCYHSAKANKLVK